MTSVEAGRPTGRLRVSREPLARAERLLVTMLAGLFVLLAAMLGAGALAFSTLSGQILGLQEQIGGIGAEIGGLRAEMHEEIGGLRIEMREEIGKLRTEMREEIGKLRTEMREEIGKLSDRMTRVETPIETHLVPRSVPPAAGS